jgi:predicted ArsR family transcriptional regulator
MKKTIQIVKVEKVKEGISQKTGRPYQIFRITDSEGESYSAFSNAYQNMVGQRVEIDYEIKETEKNGVIYKNKTIIDRTKSRTEEKLDKIIDCLKVINENIKKLEKKLDKIDGNVEGNITPYKKDETLNVREEGYTSNW